MTDIKTNNIHRLDLYDLDYYGFWTQFSYQRYMLINLSKQSAKTIWYFPENFTAQDAIQSQTSKSTNHTNCKVQSFWTSEGLKNVTKDSCKHSNDKQYIFRTKQTCCLYTLILKALQNYWKTEFLILEL